MMNSEEDERLVTIYCLKHPLDGTVHYVGQTKVPNQRRTQHRSRGDVGRNPEHQEWVEQLWEEWSMRPLFEPICRVPVEEADALEHWWIRHYREDPDAELFNKSPDGVGGEVTAAPDGRLVLDMEAEP